jgi:WD40 repeat protein
MGYPVLHFEVLAKDAPAMQRFYHDDEATNVTALKSGNVTLPNPDSEKFVIRSASPDGTVTAITDSTNRVSVYDVPQKKAFLFSVEGPPIRTLDFSADSSKLGVAQDTGQITIFDVRTGTRQSVFETGERLYTMKFLGSGQIQVVSRLGTIYFFTDAGALLKRIAFPNSPTDLTAQIQ